MVQNTPQSQNRRLSSQAYQLSAMHHLGEPVEEFHAYFGKKCVTLLLYILIGSAIIFGAFALLAHLSIASGILAAIVTALIFVGLLFLYVVLTSLFDLVNILLFLPWHVYVCVEGLVSTRAGRTKVFRWDQITEAWQKAVHIRFRSGGSETELRSTLRYKVRCKDGITGTFNQTLDKIQQLGTILINQSGRYLLPQALAAYNAGNTVAFGPLQASTQGIGYRQKLVSWEQVRYVGTEAGKVVVFVKNYSRAYFRVNVAKVPNLAVFLTLANAVLKTQEAKKA